MSKVQFDLPRALSLVLKGFSINQGDRGELLVAAFFTWARDKISVRFDEGPAPIALSQKASNASRSGDATIFQKMDPFKCGLLDDSNKVNGRFPIPIICILFSISSKEPALTQMKYNVASDGAVDIEKGLPLFMSYDFVCSGVDSKILQPVGELSKVWKVIFMNDLGMLPDCLSGNIFILGAETTFLSRPPPTAVVELQRGEPRSRAFGTGARIAGSISSGLVLLPLVSVGEEEGGAGREW
ncbi:hypothetical protein EDB83DRAFT_2316621 [Lactarius deliciosus]|nr:hypothetical protein EDB83DRAFT_2316621 [Lactarius deliciosus]